MIKMYLCGALLLGSLMYSSSANAQNTPTEQVQSQKDWTLVKSEQGVQAYFSTIQQGGAYLAIQLKNSSEADVELTYTLQKEGKQLFSPSKHKLEAQQSIELFDATRLIQVDGSGSYDNITIHLTF